MIYRLLAGEPLALDLVNTHWPHGGRPVDALDDGEFLTAWLDEHELRPSYGESLGPDDEYREPLRRARSAIRGMLEDRPGAGDELEAVLARGRLRLTHVAGRPAELVEVDDDAWAPAWQAARAYLQLLATAPTARIRHCDGADCVLWFQDTSRNGTRRWCSMAGCGNRAKASAHYRRHRPGD